MSALPFTLEVVELGLNPPPPYFWNLTISLVLFGITILISSFNSMVCSIQLDIKLPVWIFPICLISKVFRFELTLTFLFPNPHFSGVIPFNGSNDSFYLSELLDWNFLNNSCPSIKCLTVSKKFSSF
jgi:hypothetical protein